MSEILGVKKVNLQNSSRVKSCVRADVQLTDVILAGLEVFLRSLSRQIHTITVGFPKACYSIQYSTIEWQLCLFIRPCCNSMQKMTDHYFFFPRQLPFFPLHCAFSRRFSCSAPSCLLSDPWSRAGSWGLIGQDYTHSVASLPTKIRQEFMQMHSLNVTWPPLFINTHRSLSLNYKAALGTIHLVFGEDDSCRQTCIWP